MVFQQTWLKNFQLQENSCHSHDKNKLQEFLHPDVSDWHFGLVVMRLLLCSTEMDDHLVDTESWYLAQLPEPIQPDYLSVSVQNEYSKWCRTLPRKKNSDVLPAL